MGVTYIQILVYGPRVAYAVEFGSLEKMVYSQVYIVAGFIGKSLYRIYRTTFAGDFAICT